MGHRIFVLRRLRVPRILTTPSVTNVNNRKVKKLWNKERKLVSRIVCRALPRVRECRNNHLKRIIHSKVLVPNSYNYTSNVNADQSYGNLTEDERRKIEVIYYLSSVIDTQIYEPLLTSPDIIGNIHNRHMKKYLTNWRKHAMMGQKKGTQNNRHRRKHIDSATARQTRMERRMMKQKNQQNQKIDILSPVSSLDPCNNTINQDSDYRDDASENDSYLFSQKQDFQTKVFPSKDHHVPESDDTPSLDFQNILSKDNKKSKLSSNKESNLLNLLDNDDFNTPSSSSTTSSLPKLSPTAISQTLTKPTLSQLEPSLQGTSSSSSSSFSSSKPKSLIDLLGDESFLPHQTNNDNHTSKEPLPLINVSKTSPKNDITHDFGRDDQNHITKTTSHEPTLLDLLYEADNSHSFKTLSHEGELKNNEQNVVTNNDLLYTPQSDTNTPSNKNKRNHTSTLLNLLDDKKFKTTMSNIEEDTKKTDFTTSNSNLKLKEKNDEGFKTKRQLSLLDLLDKDDESNIEYSSKHEDTSISSKNLSLLDLLDNDLSFSSSISSSNSNDHHSGNIDTEEIVESNTNNKIEKSSLLNLLDENVIKETKETKENKKLPILNHPDRVADIESHDGTTISIKEDMVYRLSQIVSLIGESKQKKLFSLKPHINLYTNELLSGSETYKWILTTNDFNLLLLSVILVDSIPMEANNLNLVGLETTKAQYILQIMGHMFDLCEQIHLGFVTPPPYQHFKDSKFHPNATTLSIVTDFLWETGFREAALGTVDLFLQCGGFNANQLRKYDKSNSNDTKIKSSEIDGIFLLDGEMIDVASKIYERAGNVKALDALLRWALGEGGKGVCVGHKPFCSLLKMYQEEDERKGAIRIVRQCIEENGNTNPRGTNFFLLSAISWPEKNRDGKKAELLSYFNDLLDVLEYYEYYDGKSHYYPGFQVWKALMLATSRGTSNRAKAERKIVQRCSKAFLKFVKGKGHKAVTNDEDRHILFKIGLEAAESQGDAQLALDITSWAENKNVMDSVSCETLHKIVTPIPLIAYSRAVSVCVNSGKPDLAEQVLDGAYNSIVKCETRYWQLNNLSRVCASVIAGYAARGDSEGATRILKKMKNFYKIKPCEHVNAAYIHALAASRKHNEAVAALDSVLSQSKDSGEKISLTSECFAACMGSAMRLKNWQQVFDLNEKMISNGIKPDSSTLEAVILASSRQGGREMVLDTVDKALRSKYPMNNQIFEACSKVILPQYILGSSSNMNRSKLDNIRLNLRSLGENNGKRVANIALQLNRHLRLAEIEDRREPTKMKGSIQIAQNREYLWGKVMEDALALARLLDSQERFDRTGT